MDPFSQSIILFEKVSMTMLGIEPKGFSQIDSTPHFLSMYNFLLNIRKKPCTYVGTSKTNSTVTKSMG